MIRLEESSVRPGDLVWFRWFPHEPPALTISVYRGRRNLESTIVKLYLKVLTATAGIQDIEESVILPIDSTTPSWEEKKKLVQKPWRVEWPNFSADQMPIKV